MGKEYNAYVREALEKAEAAALASYQKYIGTEHIVIGLLSVESCLAARVLAECGLTYENYYKAVLGQSMTLGDVSETRFQGYSPKAEHVLEMARAEAERFDSDEVGTEHILIAILKEKDCIAQRLFKGMNLNRKKVSLAVLTVCGLDLA